MKVLYLECNMGVAGDMLMGALLELHPEPEKFILRLNQVGIKGVRVSVKESIKCGITGTHVEVLVNDMEEHSRDVSEHIIEGKHAHMTEPIHEGEYAHNTEHIDEAKHAHGDEHMHQGSHVHDHENVNQGSHVHDKEHQYMDQGTHVHSHAHGEHHEHRSLQDIVQLIDGLEVSAEVKSHVKRIYQVIAQAESRVHGKEVSEVHFHEVGMSDALADITGCAMLIHELNIDKIITSPVCTGYGQVYCAHGILPVPAPATALILEGMPCYGGKIEGELCTPTGAAIVKHFTTEYGNMPSMVIKKIGYGMGNKNFKAANCVRAMIGEIEEELPEITEFCCNLDDMTPEEIGFAMELLLDNGALDVFTTPIGMKKSRTGILLTVLCEKDQWRRLAELTFKHTSTIGIREKACRRMVMKRTEKSVDSAYGKIRVKESEGYGIKKQKIEFEDLRELAIKTGMSIQQMKEALNGK